MVTYSDLYDRLIRGEEKLALVGLGYVGMPIAVEFAKHVKVIGFNHNEHRIQQYKSGIDPTNEVGNEVISKTTVDFTSDEKRLAEAKFIIVAVPTPVKEDNNPDLGPVENASRIVGRNIVPGTIVVYESTVYPGVTEDICIPILEEESGLKCGVDFKIGYSQISELKIDLADCFVILIGAAIILFVSIMQERNPERSLRVQLDEKPFAVRFLLLLPLPQFHPLFVKSSII